jgi:hypothetical protein
VVVHDHTLPAGGRRALHRHLPVAVGWTPEEPSASLGEAVGEGTPGAEQGEPHSRAGLALSEKNHRNHRTSDYADDGLTWSVSTKEEKELAQPSPTGIPHPEQPAYVA